MKELIDRCGMSFCWTIVVCINICIFLFILSLYNFSFLLKTHTILNILLINDNIYCNSNLIEFVCNPVGKIKLSLFVFV